MPGIIWKYLIISVSCLLSVTHFATRNFERAGAAMHDNECFMVQCADSEEIRSPHSLQAMCSLILVLQHLGGDHCRDARSCKILQLWIAQVCGKSMEVSFADFSLYFHAAIWD